jgi:hypothetical protein
MELHALSICRSHVNSIALVKVRNRRPVVLPETTVHCGAGACMHARTRTRHEPLVTEIVSMHLHIDICSAAHAPSEFGIFGHVD